jgi:hypothetical protein
MLNSYKEIFMTYLRRPFSSWRAVVMVGLAFWNMFSDGGGMPGHFGPGSVINGVFFFSGLVWLHLREQMVQYRRTLVPGYTWPGVVVFLAISIPAVAVAPLILAMGHGFRDGIFFALAIYVFGLVGWALASNSWLAVVTGGCGFLVPLKFLHLFTLHPHATDGFAALCLLACGLTAATWAMFRLTHAIEGDRGYGPLVGSPEAKSFNKSERKAWTATDMPPAMQSGKGVVRDFMAAAAPNNLIQWPKTKTRLSAVQRWHRAGVCDYWFVGQSVFWVFFIYMLFIVSSNWTTRQVGVNFGDVGLVFAVPGLFIFPALLAGVNWLNAQLYLETESLRPATRAEFVRGIGKTFFIQTNYNCVVMMLVFLAAAGLTSGGRAGILTIAPLLLAAIIAQPIAIATVWWLIQYRNIVWLVLPAVVGLGLTQCFLLNSWLNQTRTAAAVALMLLGLLMIPLVYRRWMNLEMG